MFFLLSGSKVYCLFVLFKYLKGFFCIFFMQRMHNRLQSIIFFSLDSIITSISLVE